MTAIETGVESSRAHETRVVIDAPIEEVWKAITDPAALARWFAPKMTVEPHVGGVVLADWGPGLEWKTFIEVWEPNRHLRLAETREKVLTSSTVEQKLPPCRLVEDFYLESESGKTVLRLVHSGFGSSAEWDGEYEGTRGGWAMCFFRLKEGLERHRHESVANFLVTATCRGVESGRVQEMIEASAPRPFHVVLRGKYEFGGLLGTLNDSVFTVSAQPTPEGTMAYVEFLLFGIAAAEAAALEREWREKLSSMFPAG